MKALLVSTVLAALLVAGGCAEVNLARAASRPVADATLGAIATATQAPGSFALLELFTSEGCSSTPPAEAAVNRMVSEALAADRRVFALAYHVTYWDHLGWKDLYARSAHTDRQWAYARALRHDNVYTPQVVIDGAGDLPWSDDAAARRAVAASLGRTAQAKVSLLAERREDGVRVRFAVEGAAQGTRLQLALAERGLVVRPTRGENAGATLAHAPVVRTLLEVEPGQGEVTLAAPDGLDLDRVEVIGFVQDSRTMAIAGASRVTL